MNFSQLEHLKDEITALDCTCEWCGGPTIGLPVIYKEVPDGKDYEDGTPAVACIFSACTFCGLETLIPKPPFEIDCQSTVEPASITEIANDYLRKWIRI